MSSTDQRKANDTVLISRARREESLKISFQRTIRVPDNQKASELPPSLGTFPLYLIAPYKEKMPSQMAAKGGLFFPMYRKSPFHVNFTSRLKDGT